MDEFLLGAARRAIDYRRQVATEPVRPDPLADLTEIAGPLPEDGSDPEEVIKLLDTVVTPATMGFSSPRFFGWVIGGVYPVALAADWLTSAWDQNAASYEASPGVTALENTAINWIKSAAGLPDSTWGAFVTGTTVAHITALAAARTKVLADAGWDATDNGLFGAPEVTVVVGEEAHPSLIKALGVVGLGRKRVVTVPVDDQGRMLPSELPAIDGPTIVCVQAGNVNSGAFDPMSEIVPTAKEQGAWVHVDGAFGFWAAVSSSLRHLSAGQELADSWATDCHKYLNVPYDAGVALVREASSLENVMSVHASYLLDWSIHVDQMQYTPEMSRRARGIPTYAVLRHLGRSGLERLIDHTVDMAQLFARLLSEQGFDILNDVVLNQVLVSFGTPEQTQRVIKTVQQEGVMYAGPTEWHGRTAMRISVSGYSTTEDDVSKSVEAMIRAARS